MLRYRYSSIYETLTMQSRESNKMKDQLFRTSPNEKKKYKPFDANSKEECELLIKRIDAFFTLADEEIEKKGIYSHHTVRDVFSPFNVILMIMLGLGISGILANPCSDDATPSSTALVCGFSYIGIEIAGLVLLFSLLSKLAPPCARAAHFEREEKILFKDFSPDLKRKQGEVIALLDSKTRNTLPSSQTLGFFVEAFSKIRKKASQKIDQPILSTINEEEEKEEETAPLLPKEHHAITIYSS
jgi:hypothetical protein